MRTDLEDDPGVISISRAVHLQTDHVVGKLHRFWSWVDAHTADGFIPGVDAVWVDSYVKRRGFAVALSATNPPWLVITAEGISVPHFEHWFGTSAKRRLKDTRRKQDVRGLSADCPPNGRKKTGLPDRTRENLIIAPELGGADLDSVRNKANEITDKLGKCGTSQNRRLVMGACVLAGKLGDAWLDNAVRETRDAHAEKPYAYLKTILSRTAEAAGVDFRSSVAAMNFAATSRAISSEGGGGGCV